MQGSLDAIKWLEGSNARILSAWGAGNKALMESMGEDYYFLDDSELGTAMLINEDVLSAIRDSLVNGFDNVDNNALTNLVKSVASGTYFTEHGRQLPKVTPMQTQQTSSSAFVEVESVDKERDASISDRMAKARQVGRGNPVFQKLMPGSLNGMFMGKTGKFIVEYPNGANVASILRENAFEIADFADEKLGNEECASEKQRIFVSDELQKDDCSVCVIMYHGIDGDKNSFISDAVKESIREFIRQPVEISKTYAVLNTELTTAENKCVSLRQNAQKKKIIMPNADKSDAAVLDERLSPSMPNYASIGCSLC